MALSVKVGSKLWKNSPRLTGDVMPPGQFTVFFSMYKSTTATGVEPSPDSIHHRTNPPDFPTHDWIGPVDSRSNLHRIQFAQPKDETKSEKRYRLLREATHAWNQDFWSKQNDKFMKAKQQFTLDTFVLKGQEMTNEDGTKRVLTAEELAEFYTAFLAQNREVYRTYNREWYKRNLYMLWPAACAAVVSWCRPFRMKPSS